MVAWVASPQAAAADRAPVRIVKVRLRPTRESPRTGMFPQISQKVFFRRRFANVPVDNVLRIHVAGGPYCSHCESNKRIIPRTKPKPSKLAAQNRAGTNTKKTAFCAMLVIEVPFEVPCWSSAHVYNHSIEQQISPGQGQERSQMTT